MSRFSRSSALNLICGRFAIVIAACFVLTPMTATAADVEADITANSEDHGFWIQNLLHGKTDTVWRSQWNHRKAQAPIHELTITFSAEVEIAGLTLIHDEQLGAGKAKGYKLEVAGQSISGTFTEKGEQKITLNEKVTTKSLNLKIESCHKGLPWVSIAELRINAPGAKLKWKAPSENVLKTREENRRHGIAPPKKDKGDDLLKLVVRTYEMVGRAKGNVNQFKSQLENLIGQFASKQNDGRYKEELTKLRRQIVLSHPKLAFKSILVNKRRPPGYSHQCDQYLGRHSSEAIGPCEISDWKTNPKCKALLEGKLPKGDYRKPDLSYDGKKIAFAFCDHEANQGDARAFFLYECNADGSGLRQLTGTERDDRAGWENRTTVLTEDFDPCYLPDGGFAFISTRSQTFGRCHAGRYTPTYLVYGMDKDGNNIRQLSLGEANEWDPSVLDNGRLVYTRWDYINRHAVKFQSLWTMQPDGTGIAHYHGNYSDSPCMQAECRQIPGTKKTVFTGTSHHSYTAGTIFTCDPVKGEDGWGPLGRVTPETQSPECNDPYGKDKNQTYCAPWPLSEELYLVSRLPRSQARQGSRDKDDNARWEIYLVDIYGGRELIYKDDTISCFAPIPLEARNVPRRMPSQLNLASKEETGTFYVQNVYDCRQPIEAGTAKFMRINKIYGQVTRVSSANNEILKQCIGYAPINANGSVAFKAPAGYPLQLQLCDENKMAIMTMRSFVTLQKGEVASCTGCHEPRESAPTTMMNYAKIRVQSPHRTKGPEYKGGFSFARTVQPVLDRYCISCHGLKKAPKDISLLGKPGGRGSTAYTSLVKDRGLVKVAYRNRETGYSKPKEYYAHAGRLAAHLMTNEKHLKNVKLDKESMTRIVEWLDLNGQYFGDYSKNRVEDRKINGAALSALREKIKARFGNEIAAQPTEALINVAMPSESRALLAPLAENQGGWGQWKNGFNSKNDANYMELVAMVDACVVKRNEFDVRGTCGRERCSCGCCFVRLLAEKQAYPPVDRQFRQLSNANLSAAAKLDKSKWKLVRVDSEETDVADMRAINAFDGDESTYWCTQFDKATPTPPHELVIDLGASKLIGGISYLPRRGIGDIKDCEFYVSDNPNSFGDPVDQVKFTSQDRTNVSLANVKKGRYLMVRTLSERRDGLYSSIRELDVYEGAEEKTAPEK